MLEALDTGRQLIEGAPAGAAAPSRLGEAMCTVRRAERTCRGMGRRWFLWIDMGAVKSLEGEAKGRGKAKRGDGQPMEQWRCDGWRKWHNHVDSCKLV